MSARLSPACPMRSVSKPSRRFVRWFVAIPGARNPAQASSNAEAAGLPAISDSAMQQIKSIYDTYIKQYVHQRW